jgi:6-phosphogluconate dehydrogenase (decarboxylating)
MIHNVIEYGMMQAHAEGLSLIGTERAFELAAVGGDAAKPKR